jgi:Flp pilus assembly protein TadB
MDQVRRTAAAHHHGKAQALMKIDITPNTPESDLRRLAAHTYLLQAWACVAAAAMVMLVYYITSILVIIPAVLCIYFSARLFNSSAQARASLRNLIKLRRLLP